MSETFLPAARGYEMSKILNGPWISLVMFIIVAFLFAMTVWNCIIYNKIRNHTVVEPKTAKRPISKREATTLLVINVVMSILLAFIAAFFLWKVFLEESVRVHFVKVGKTVGVYSGNVKEYFSRKNKPSASTFDVPPLVAAADGGAGVTTVGAGGAADLSELFESDPSALYKTDEPGFFTTEDKMKRFRCFRKYDTEASAGAAGVGLPARFRPSAAPASFVSPPSIQPSFPEARRVLDSRRPGDLIPLSQI